MSNQYVQSLVFNIPERLRKALYLFQKDGVLEGIKRKSLGWSFSKIVIVLFNANCFWTNLFKSVSEPLKKQLRKNSIGIQWVIQHINSMGNSLKCKVYRFIQSRKKLPWIERQSYVFYTSLQTHLFLSIFMYCISIKAG